MNKFSWSGFLVVLMMAQHSLMAAEGVFSSVYLGSGNFDTAVGLTNSKTYFNAVNLNGGALTINGVSFAAASGANPSGANWTTAGFTHLSAASVNNLSGQLGSLVNDFCYNQANASMTLTLTNLVAGQPYVMTFYNLSWEAAGGRVQTIIASSGARTVFDEDMGASGQGYGNLLRYTFNPTGTVEGVTFSGGTSMHQYGFSTEQVFNKSWVSGANWSTATWSPGGSPNAAGANASFTAQGAPTTLSLDAPMTAGHLQFDGTNAWTVIGANTLTLQTDPGGVSVLNAVAGTHTLTAPVSVQNDLIKFGAGGVMLADGSGSGKVTVSAGLLQLGKTALLYNSDPAKWVKTNISVAAGATLAFNVGGSGEFSAANVTTLLDNLTKGINTNGFQAGSAIGFDTSHAAGNNFTVADAIANSTGAGAGSLGLTKLGSNTLTLTGTNLYTGATTIQQGTLNIGNGSALGLGGGIAFTGNATLQAGAAAVSVSPSQTVSIGNGVTATLDSNGNTLYLGGAISGASASGLTTTGSGTVVLGAANTYTGTTTISGGTLQLAADTATSAPTITNASFEAPVVGSYTYYRDMNASQKAAFAWTAVDNGGGVLASHNSSPFMAVNAPDGVQACTLQQAAYITQNLTIGTPGFYTLSWTDLPRNTQLNPYTVQFGSLNFGTFSTTNAYWQAHSVSFYVATAGAYLLKFAGTSGSDNSVNIDKVSLTGTAGGLLPSNTVVNITSPTGVFDVNNRTQMISSLTLVPGATVTNAANLRLPRRVGTVIMTL